MAILRNTIGKGLVIDCVGLRKDGLRDFNRIVKRERADCFAGRAVDRREPFCKLRARGGFDFIDEHHQYVVVDVELIDGIMACGNEEEIRDPVQHRTGFVGPARNRAFQIGDEIDRKCCGSHKFHLVSGIKLKRKDYINP